MKVHCPDCGTLVRAEDLNLQTLLARCRTCDGFFSFAEAARVEGVRALGRVPGHEEAASLPRPARILVEDSGLAWVARWRWFSPSVLFLVFFCVAWDGFLVFWYTTAVSGRGSWIAILFPLGHVAVGLTLTYFTLATLLNSTRVRVTRGELSVRSAPVPWVGNRVLPAAAVRQLFARSTHQENNRPLFGLFAVLDDGRSVRLVGGLQDAGEAGFLQQQLEMRLQIRPSPLLQEA